VVGGVLASAFVQSSFSPKVIGLCGVIVLVSSLFNQHYHPEVRATESAQRMKELQTLIRDSEDRLVLISAKLHTNPNATQTLMELALQISSMLNAIDMAGTPKQDELRILPVPREKMLGA
jgi:inactivated superfamily I helicase